jgi:teichuronic acid biosynthesis glycosyltransferase TuaC
MNILTYTSLFPNVMSPELGVFIYQRMRHVSQRPGSNVRVVSPLPFFPRWPAVKRWQKYSMVPYQDLRGGLQVSYPKYPLLPGIAMPWHGALMYRGSLGAVARIHREAPIDCIDAHFVYPDGYAALRIGRKLGIPVVVSARGTDIDVYPKYSSIRPKIAWTLENAAGVIAVSNSLKLAMMKMGIREDKIRVIPNGIDSARFFPGDMAAARQKLQIPAEAEVLVSVGNLYPQKCHDRLISAFAGVSASHPQLRLYILGEGWLRGALEKQIRAERLEGRVVLAGQRPNEELQTWFSAANLSCLASSREGWPNVVSESLGCGTPVIATDAGGVSEILATPGLGMVVEQSIEGVREGIRAGLARSWDRAAIANHSLGRTWTAVAQEVQSYLEQSARRP